MASSPRPEHQTGAKWNLSFPSNSTRRPQTAQDVLAQIFSSGGQKTPQDDPRIGSAAANAQSTWLRELQGPLDSSGGVSAWRLELLKLRHCSILTPERTKEASDQLARQVLRRETGGPAALADQLKSALDLFFDRDKCGASPELTRAVQVIAEPRLLEMTGAFLSELARVMVFVPPRMPLKCGQVVLVAGLLMIQQILGTSE